MQPATARKAKYAAKFDPVVIEMRLVAIKTIAIAHADDAFDSLTAMEILTQAVLNEDGILQMARPMYYNFARQVWKAVADGLTDPALTALVVVVLGPKYEAMGAAAATLIKIALDVFSIVLPP